MIRYSIRLKWALVCCVLMPLDGVAWAQEQSKQGTDAAASQLQEIVVTARRVRENLEKIPVSVTVVTARTLQEQQIKTVFDLEKLVPGLSVATPEGRAAESYFIRGANTTINNDPTNAPSVQPYLNEVPFYSTIGNFYDLQDVQVLKGPQGTLFGRNTIGGAVLFETKKPIDDFGGYITTTFGNYGREEGTGAINIPIYEDKVVLRIAGDVYHRDGFTHDLVTNQELDSRDYEGYRVSLRLHPIDEIESTTIYDALRVSAPTSQIIGEVDPNIKLGRVTAGFLYSLPPASGFFGIPVSAWYDQVAQVDACKPRCSLQGPQIQEYNLRNFGITNITTYHLSDDLTLKNIAAYRQNKQYIVSDLGGSALLQLYGGQGGQFNEIQVFSDEFQLQGESFKNQLKWVAGLYGEWRDPGQASVLNQTNLHGIAPPTSIFTYSHGYSRAIFGQGSYDLSDYIPKLTFTAGVRETWDTRQLIWKQTSGTTYSQVGNCLIPGLTSLSVADSRCAANFRAGFRAPSYDLSFDYQVTDDVLAYVAQRRGYKSGGFNQNAQDTQFASYQPEYMTDVEIGTKAQFDVGGVAVRTNADAYFEWYRGIQISQAVLNPQSGGIATVVLNGGISHIDGFELESTIIPNNWLQFTLSYALTNPVYEKAPSPTQVLSQTSRHTANVSARIDVPIPDNWGDDLALNLSGSYRSGTWANTYTVTDPTYALCPVCRITEARIGAFFVADANIDWKGVGGYPVDANFFVTNLFDRTYVQGMFPGPQLIGMTSYVYGEPRMYGIQLTYHFGAGD